MTRRLLTALVLLSAASLATTITLGERLFKMSSAFRRERFEVIPPVVLPDEQEVPSAPIVANRAMVISLDRKSVV